MHLYSIQLEEHLSGDFTVGIFTNVGSKQSPEAKPSIKRRHVVQILHIHYLNCL